VRRGRDRLRPGRVVNVCDRGNERPLVFTYLDDVEHEGIRSSAGRGRRARELEPFGRVFGKQARRVRTIALAELDPPVQRVLHCRIAWVREDRSMTERARTRFRGAIEPADDTSI